MAIVASIALTHEGPFWLSTIVDSQNGPFSSPRDTLASLRALNAMLSSVPVTLEAMAEDLETNPSLPLMKWWHEAKAAA